jgi:MoxR-like ATPase
MSWSIFKGNHAPHDGIKYLPPPPAWRSLGDSSSADRRGRTFEASPEEVEVVNAALYLRRPLLITGKPGTGKSTLAYAVAHELMVGPVLRWPITTRSTLQEGLYAYDAVARLQDASLVNSVASPGLPDIGRYIRLGPLGTALLPSGQPRVLLIDEIDKSDIDLPNDLLHVFEEGVYQIPELARLIAPEFQKVSVGTWDGERATITGGHVGCTAFPFVVLTSNGEREFAPAFLRRCLRLTIAEPDEAKLARIVAAHLGRETLTQVEPLIEAFVKRRSQGRGDLATDQLLNAIYLVTQATGPIEGERKRILDVVLKSLEEE